MSLPLNYIQFIGAVEMGLIYGLIAIGVYLSFRTLQFPDMTVDGSFPLGAAVAATLITGGINPYLATMAAIFAGVLAGMVTAWLSTHLKMLNLLAGILTMFALYSINLRIMGRPNISLTGEITIFSGWLGKVPAFVSLSLITLTIAFLVYRFLGTRLGLAIRATGSNARMGRSQGIDDRKMIITGLGMANGLMGLAGALYAQIHNFADATMGTGTLLYGLASLILGETLFPRRTIFQAIIACLLGTIVYFNVRAVALNIDGLGVQASDLNLITAILVAGAMLLPGFNRKRSADKQND
jgi:putative ABC transport system permease protein